MSASFSSFLPHETCYLFNSGLIWLHGLSDSAIAIAYYAIPLELLYFTRNRRDLPFPLIFIAFGVFILGCGTTHVMEVVTLWVPVYWLSGSIKAITAIASVATAILTLYIIPPALALRSPAELENLNRQLSMEIRERRAAEAEVIKSRAAMIRQERIRVADQLASGIAHDLNNTLNVLVLRLNLIKRDTEFAQKHAASLQAIDLAVNDATRTVARVQELAKPRMVAPDEFVQIKDVVAEAIDLARTSIEGRPASRGHRVTIEQDIADGLPPVRGQLSDLRQVLLNLLLNASDATLDGKIEIGAAIENEEVVVRVLDEGSGIPPDQVTRLFEPFFTTKGPRGTGLGLSIAREIVEGIGGTIQVANRENGGAVITLRFPILAPPILQSAAALPADGQARRFLLVDDDEENLAALKVTLLSVGHEADTALSGPAALEKIRDGASYDVILCDLGMAGMDGWETARKTFEVLPHQRFYIVTGWAQHLDPSEVPALPIAGIISKPIDIAEINRIVSSLRP
jgi:two-component system, cell cycle sensor histidine kinase and response regulator CckA